MWHCSIIILSEDSLRQVEQRHLAEWEGHMADELLDRREESDRQGLEMQVQELNHKCVCFPRQWSHNSVVSGLLVRTPLTVWVCRTSRLLGSTGCASRSRSCRTWPCLATRPNAWSSTRACGALARRPSSAPRRSISGCLSATVATHPKRCTREGEQWPAGVGWTEWGARAEGTAWINFNGGLAAFIESDTNHILCKSVHIRACFSFEIFSNYVISGQRSINMHRILSKLPA